MDTNLKNFCTVCVWKTAQNKDEILPDDYYTRWIDGFDSESVAVSVFSQTRNELSATRLQRYCNFNATRLIDTCIKCLNIYFGSAATATSMSNDSSRCLSFIQESTASLYDYERSVRCSSKVERTYETRNDNHIAASASIPCITNRICEANELNELSQLVSHLITKIKDH